MTFYTRRPLSARMIEAHQSINFIMVCSNIYKRVFSLCLIIILKTAYYGSVTVRVEYRVEERKLLRSPLVEYFKLLSYQLIKMNDTVNTSTFTSL